MVVNRSRSEYCRIAEKIPMGTANQQDQAERQQVDGERDGQALEDLVLHLPAVGEGLAEIEGHELPEPGEVLLVHGLVGPVSFRSRSRASCRRLGRNSIWASAGPPGAGA